MEKQPPNIDSRLRHILRMPQEIYHSRYSWPAHRQRVSPSIIAPTESWGWLWRL